jgi:very-short-patch-repair endonuclease
VSKGAKELLEALRVIFPQQRVVLEHHLGEKLFLDFYLPFLDLAFEFDGIQHTKYVEHFHGNAEGFYKSKMRDARKAELCMEQGITLIRFDHNDSLDVEAVRERISEHLV